MLALFSGYTCNYMAYSNRRQGAHFSSYSLTSPKPSKDCHILFTLNSLTDESWLVPSERENVRISMVLQRFYNLKYVVPV